MKRLIDIFVVVFLAFIIAACQSTPKVDHEGAFIVKGGKLIELPFSNAYPFVASENDPIIKDNNPTLLVSFPANPDDVGLNSVTKNQFVKTDNTTTQGSVIKMTPKSNLDDGDYCIIVGDSFKAYEELTHWCFRIGDPKKIAAQATETYKRSQTRLNVPPQSEGMYYVTSEQTVESLMQDLTYKSKLTYLHRDNIPLITENRPVFVFSSSTISPQNIRLEKANLKLGFNRTNDTPCNLSPTAGVRTISSGGTLVKIDDVQVDSCDTYLGILNQGDPFHEYHFQFMRGTNLQDVVASPPLFAFDGAENIPIYFEMKEGYAGFMVMQDLRPGVYCFGDQNDDRVGYCFTRTDMAK